MRRAFVTTCVLLGLWLAAARPGHGIPMSQPRQRPGRVFTGGQNAPAAQEKNHPAPEPADYLGRLSALEERLFEDAADGQLDECSLLDAALIAGGVQRPEELQRRRRQLAEVVEKFRRSGKVVGSARRRAEAVLQLMHRRVLYAGYAADCTDLRTAMDHGRFNCISATVLFNCLAAEFELETCGLEIPGHAMSRLFLPRGPLDLETTCPRWFRLIDNPEKQAEALGRTIGRISPQARSKVREVSAVQLAAMIYYNRGVDLLAEKRFAEAATANAKALLLDPNSTTARGNLLAVLNNWAIELGAAGHHAEAAKLLRQGLAFDPTYDPFTMNYVYVHYKWVEDLCSKGRFQEALAVLARAAEELPESDYFRLAPADVWRRWTTSIERRTVGDPCNLTISAP